MSQPEGVVGKGCWNYWDAQTCPNCGTAVGIGIMSLQATCQCGWWWDDVAKLWSRWADRP